MKKKLQEALPCPFCGKEPYVGASPWGPGVVACCLNPKCPTKSLSTNHKKDSTGAIAAWNTRRAPKKAKGKKA